MIKIETKNETAEGCDMKVLIRGNELTVLQQMISLFDKLYEVTPEVFEHALVLSKCGKDHT